MLLVWDRNLFLDMNRGCREIRQKTFPISSVRLVHEHKIWKSLLLYFATVPVMFTSRMCRIWNQDENELLHQYLIAFSAMNQEIISEDIFFLLY